VPIKEKSDKFGSSVNVPITPQQISKAIDALEAIGPMSSWIQEWDRESTNVVALALNCSKETARDFWRTCWDKNLVELISDYHGEPVVKIDSQWSWKRNACGAATIHL
jgi:hypothetical protein